MDPIVILPFEVFELVISSLEYGEIIGCLRVSKKWQANLNTFHKITRAVEFNYVQSIELIRRGTPTIIGRLDRDKPLSSFTLKSNDADCATYICDLLKGQVNWSAIDRICLDIKPTVYWALEWNQWRSLKELELRCTRFPASQVTISMLNTYSDLRKLTINCRRGNSQSFELITSLLPDNERLEELVLNVEETKETEKFQAKAQFPIPWPYPNLQRLELANLELEGALDLSKCRKLRELTLLRCSFAWTNRYRAPPNIEILNVQPTCPSYLYWDSFFKTWKLSLPHLTSLRLGGWESTEALRRLIELNAFPVSRLQHLRLDKMMTPSVSSDHVRELCFDDLKTLRLSGSGTGELNLEVVTTLFPNIHTLDVDTFLVTPEFMIELLEHKDHKIKILRLRYGDRIPQWIVDWAGRIGMSVRIVTTQMMEQYEED